MNEKFDFITNTLIIGGGPSCSTLARKLNKYNIEGIYYSMRSARILANSIVKNNPELYEKEWKETFEKTFKSYHWAERFFLYSDFMSNRMLNFFKNKALKYWDNKVKPINPKYMIVKFIKYFFKR